MVSREPGPGRGSSPPDRSVSLIVPLHDEEANVGPVVADAVAYLSARGAPFEIILVDDGSADRTAERASALCGSDERVRLVRHGSNRGYGAALASGLAAARRESIVVMDGDGQFAASEIGKLLGGLARHDVVAGRRVDRKDPRLRVWLGRAYSALVRRLFGLELRDVNCGLKALRRRTVAGMEIASRGAVVDAEILVKARRSGLSIHEVPVEHRPRTRGRPTGGRPAVIARAVWELARLVAKLGLR